ncbi:MAG: hypothetical protein RLN88_13430 [Ekhidna sp.]|uniref:hypothetical protein n=1 Tax=Ekhidna sp. TaxID=2608089 RepID=UPI0032EF902D
MEDIPSYVSATFIAIVIAVLGFIYYAVSVAAPGKKNITSSVVITLLIGWIFFVSAQTFNGFFTNLSGVPRLPIFVAIPTLTIILLLIWPRTRAVLMNMPITTLHYMHIIRVPVEMVLWWLAVSRAIPFDMTFEGSNFDIISGISAPFAAVFMVGTRSKSRIGAIIWNLIALGLLVNIVGTAISYLPYFFTPTGGEVANLGVFYFPYVLLPTFVVPVVLFSHLVSLYQLIFKKDQSQF